MTTNLTPPPAPTSPQGPDAPAPGSEPASSGPRGSSTVVAILIIVLLFKPTGIFKGKSV